MSPGGSMKILELTGYTSKWAIEEQEQGRKYTLHQWYPCGSLYMHGIYKTTEGFGAIGQKPVKVKITVEVE
jgi:hypothetical protein